MIKLRYKIFWNCKFFPKFLSLLTLRCTNLLYTIFFEYANIENILSCFQKIKKIENPLLFGQEVTENLVLPKIQNLQISLKVQQQWNINNILLLRSYENCRACKILNNDIFQISNMPWKSQVLDQKPLFWSLKVNFIISSEVLYKFYFFLHALKRAPTNRFNSVLTVRIEW